MQEYVSLRRNSTLSHTGLQAPSTACPAPVALWNRCTAEPPAGRLSNCSSRNVQLSFTLRSINGRIMMYQLLRIFTCISYAHFSLYFVVKMWPWIFQLQLLLSITQLRTLKRKGNGGQLLCHIPNANTAITGIHKIHKLMNWSSKPLDFSLKKKQYFSSKPQTLFLG
jgi:hypothetical protein